MFLAQLNIAQAKYDMESDGMKEFVDNLEKINGLAEQSPGFVWRLKDDSGDATSIQAFEDPSIIVNMSVWENLASLKNFVFATEHKHFLARKKEWFVPLEQAAMVLWLVEASHLPTVEEAVERLTHLRKHGETDYAFSFRYKNQHVLAE